MSVFGTILLAVLHVFPGGSVQDAVDSARVIYETKGEASTILISPGTYYECLTVDAPYVTLRNADRRPSIAVRKGGVEADPHAVRLSWYNGHGYQYRSMGGQFNYGGSRTRLWNASVLITAPGVVLQNLIIENSFNLYVSPAELQDSLLPMGPKVDPEVLRSWGVTQEFQWTEKEQPKKQMPNRPREVFNTLVQNRDYRERASAVSFAGGATACRMLHCRVVGRQDAFYGDHGSEVLVEKSILAGAVDYIFGGLELTVRQSELVAMLNSEKGDKCYIAAGRGAVRASLPDSLASSVPQEEYARQGMLFEKCVVRYATPDELVHPGQPGTAEPVWLARPWRWWGKHVFRHLKAAKNVLQTNPVSLGLTKGVPAPFVVIE